MRRLVVPSAAFLALILVAAPVSAASWTAPAAITGSHQAFPPYARSLASAGGVVHLVDSRTVGKLQYRRSTDGGAHWSQPVTLAKPDATFTSVIGDPAIAARGSLVVFAYRAHDATAAYLFIRRSTDGGLTWSPRQRIARVVTTRRIGEQSVAISSAGVFVAWTDRTNGHIDLRRSTDGGVHFAAVQRIGTTTNTFAAGDPTFTDGFIGLAAAGHAVYLAWSPTGQGQADSIVLSRSLDGGATFAHRKTIVAAPSLGWPALSAAGPYLVGEFTAADGSLWSIDSVDSGKTVAIHQLATNTTLTNVAGGSVAVSASGRAVFSYNRVAIPSGSENPVGYVMVRSSVDGGAHWSAPDTAAATVPAPGNIGAALTGSGTLLIFGTCSDVASAVCDIDAVRGN